MRALAILVATAGGVGYAPVASGTFGSLVAVPFLPLLAALWTRSPVAWAAAVFTVIVLAVWSAGRADEIFGAHDSSRIVIDEVAGMIVAGCVAPPGWLSVGVAFVLFRLLDIVKPFPAGRIDGEVPGGVGVVGDDLVAGFYAGLLTRLVLAVVL